ncbi:MAG: hypothetical protein ACRDXE_03240 [Acidimicrobiales bacterium]
MSDASDAATGLPPLDEVGDDPVMLVMACAGGEGLVASPISTEAVKFLHFRGLVPGTDGRPEWAQIHVAIPYQAAMMVAAVLADDGATGG